MCSRLLSQMEQQGEEGTCFAIFWYAQLPTQARRPVDATACISKLNTVQTSQLLSLYLRLLPLSVLAACTVAQRLACSMNTYQHHSTGAASR